MHEALFSDRGLAEGFSTLDIAKGLIDEGYHPMTVFFPLVVHGAMLVEPTETESKAVLDQFIGALDRKSVVWGKGVSVRLALGGRRSIKQKQRRKINHSNNELN